MPIINRIADRHDAITEWRRDYHQHPELLFDVHRTAASVAEKLRAFGCDEVVEGIGRTGVVGVIKGREGGDRVIGLRADMDALPLPEVTGLPHASKVPGVMHACGHLHNVPGLPIGDFSTCQGPIMASTDTFEIEITGRGGHAAMPHLAVDTIVVVAHLIFAVSIAEKVSGSGRVNPQQSPVMGGEDFAYMLEERPGAFMFIGNGDSAGLHNPAYDFNDDVIPAGCSYWITLVETAMPRAA